MGKKEEGPDQARSWAIAMAGCVINSLLSGISRTTGLFYVSLIETYGVSRMEANMPFTLRNVVRNLGGPLAGAIGQRYGARDVTFIGGIFAFLGITLCTFAPNVFWIAVFWGGMHGFGVALGNTLFPVIINQYFLKYRATASGIALSGACVGSFVLPVALEYMLKNIGLSGTFLITGALIMHVLPAAILMKEPPWIKKVSADKSKTKCKEKVVLNNSSSVSRNLQSIKEERDLEDITVINIKKIPSSNILCEDVKEIEEDSFQPIDPRARVFSRNGVDNPAFVGSKSDIVEENAGQIKEGLPENLGFNAFMLRSWTAFQANGPLKDSCGKIVIGLQPNMKTNSLNANDRLLQEEGDLHEGMRIRTISIGESSVTFPKESFREVQETSIAKGILLMIRNPMFHVISISLGGFAMLFDPAITVIVDYIKDKGLEEDDAKYFISMMSLGDLLGRLCFGWVTDRNYMTLPKFMLLIQVVQGICFLLLPLFRTFDILLTLIMIYGLASGATLVMFPILVSKYLASVQSLAIGFISIFTGVLSFSVPPLIGYFRDQVGSYEGMFLITGGLSIAAGGLWLFEPLLTRLQKSHHSASVTINS